MEYLKIIVKDLICVFIIIFFFSLILKKDFYQKKFGKVLIKINNKKKFFKFLFIIVKIVIILILGYEIKNLFVETFNLYKKETQKNNLINKIDTCINEELDYIEKLNKNYSEVKNPYIPNNFSYKEGTIEEGFVVQDEKENEYVWVPCNSENVIQKRNFSANPFILFTECYDEDYKAFINSCLENGGFYISRYEIGNVTNTPVSKKGVKIWNEITYEETKNIIENMYDSLNCKLINGIAYDMTLNWILKDNKEIIALDFETEDVYITGRNECKKIYDIKDNMLELTDEKSYSDTIILRGFEKKEHEEVKAFRENDKFDNRFMGLKENKNNINVAFRTIIYK